MSRVLTSAERNIYSLVSVAEVEWEMMSVGIRFAGTGIWISPNLSFLVYKLYEQ